MKRFYKVICLLSICLLVSGCFKRDNLEDVNIYTTVYPVEYITERLYGENSQVLSIYPDEIDVNSYELTEKQIEDYSEAAIFVYNGLTNEKQVARELINENKKIQIIDVSYGLNYSYGVEELWLSPNNYLMLCTNVKNNLQEFIVNKFIKDEIEENFKVLEEELSMLDADLRSTASAAADLGQNVLVVNDSVFKYLENYGFIVIDLSDKETEVTNLTANFKNGTYKYILVRDDVAVSEEIMGYVEKYDVELVEVEMMHVLTEQQRKDKENYLGMMKVYLDNIKNIVLS